MLHPNPPVASIHVTDVTCVDATDSKNTDFVYFLPEILSRFFCPDLFPLLGANEELWRNCSSSLPCSIKVMV